MKNNHKKNGKIASEPVESEATLLLEGEEHELLAAPGASDPELEKLRKELLYQAAEVENFKRRTENRYRDMVRFAPEPLVRDLLPVMDNLERAMGHLGDSSPAVAEGLGHVLAQFKETLSRHGVEEIEAQGAKFDPNFHEALTQMPGPEEGMVLFVQEKGYMMLGKLIRPSKVVVSRLA